MPDQPLILEIQIKPNLKRLVGGDTIEGEIVMYVSLLEVQHYQEVHAIFAGVIETAGWSGAWKTVQEQEPIRQFCFGEYAAAAVALTLPDIDMLPIATSIPFTVKLTRFTKPMQWKDGRGTLDPVFPALVSRSK
ncbi:hypothetical protein PHLCEN_2v251 [Hermanssonia centrifuga]|uniref:Uncharacterized protein n=1 Tax=Hermanssonia centrifuga TaxID=98765 RepID=A0A2R6S6U0_9APHY|nr:hypothetical protein PHLCEN_2v251 [Hermanssonia centrifuga]